MRLDHVSDQAGIRTFHPRAGRDGAAAVWAIHEDKLANYMLPRDCPRVAFWRGSRTTDEDAQRLLVGAQHVVAIEYDWLQRCFEANIFLYEFDPAPFELADTTAGYYIAREPVQPLNERVIRDVFDELSQRGVEVRILPTLWNLREQVATSSLDFSIIRMRNAGPMPAGFESRFPVAR